MRKEDGRTAVREGLHARREIAKKERLLRQGSDQCEKGAATAKRVWEKGSVIVISNKDAIRAQFTCEQGSGRIPGDPGARRVQLSCETGVREGVWTYFRRYGCEKGATPLRQGGARRGLDVF